MSGPWARFKPFTGAENKYLISCGFEFSSQCGLGDILTIYTPYYRIPQGEEIVKFGDEGSLNFLFARYAKSFCLCKLNILRLKLTPSTKTNLCQFIKVPPGSKTQRGAKLGEEIFSCCLFFFGTARSGG